MSTTPEVEGWYVDPHNRDLERYFDGEKWTVQIRFPDSKPKNPELPDFSKARSAEEVWAPKNASGNPRLAADRAARVAYSKKKKKGLFNRRKKRQ